MKVRRESDIEHVYSAICDDDDNDDNNNNNNILVW